MLPPEATTHKPTDFHTVPKHTRVWFRRLLGLTKRGFGLSLDWSKSAPPPEKPTARPSQFADWVYRNSLPRRSFGSASEHPDFCKRLEKGVLDHDLIDRSIQATWVQKHIGSSTPSDWIKEYIDGFFEDPKP